MESKKEADLCRIEWCDRPIVRVLGTVMTRDDALGGWVPYLNGGQSKVGIHESVDGRRYRIYGWRVNDKKVTLDCFIQRNMVFHETIGTFHHWKIGDKKMGLTFYTPAEARSFNRGVRVALEKLARVAEYTSSSASSTCSRLSDDHQSCCTSPASSTGSSSPCEKSSFSRLRSSHESKKSTSSTSSSSSRHGTRKRSPGIKQGRSYRATHNSTSSNTSMQNRTNHSHHITSAPVVTAAPALSLLSSTSPRFCDPQSSIDLGQPHFRYPLPQQQPYVPNLTFLNRPITKDNSPYELSALALPSPRSASYSSSREPEVPNVPPKLMPRCGLEESDVVDDITKNNDKTTTVSPQTSNIQPHQRESTNSRNRQTSPNEGRSRGHHHSSRPKHTKTPYLDNATRLRDLKPTEPNSYVLFSSSKPATAHGSQHIAGRSLTGIGASLPGGRPEYKALGQMAVVDGFQYHPILSSVHTSPPFQHPQTGTLSIMASTTDASRFYNRADMYFTSNIDNIKDDAIFYEPGSSLISSPKKSKFKDTYYADSMSDIQQRTSSNCNLCCCPGFIFRSRRRRSSSHNHFKEDLAERSRCTHCREMFNHECNRPGSCKYAPDKCLENINKVTCMCCVSSIFYHCCRDDEGDYDEQPCSCSSRGRGRSKTMRHWSALAALSVIFPCLCLYPPLSACHSCGVACHCCGGKHQASYSSTKSTDKQPNPKR